MTFLPALKDRDSSPHGLGFLFHRRPRPGCPGPSYTASAGIGTVVGACRQPGGKDVLGGVAVPVVPGAAAGARPVACPEAQRGGLYDLLELTAPAGSNPFTTLNRTVAVAMVHGPEVGLEVLATLAADKRMAGHHRLLAARAHLHELAGDTDEAAAGYFQAARRATSVPERRYLALQAARLTR